MAAVKLTDNVYWVGANVHTEDLFEGIWPTPNGVTLNSYVVKGDKTAVVELVREWGGASLTLLQNLRSLGIAPQDIHYIVLNHLEPDHTGFTYTLRNLAPRAEIVCTQRGAALVDGFYGIKDNVRTVKTGDTLDLGQGKELVFVEIPHVHWPETMVSFEKSSGILFSSDAFGSFGAFRGSIFDDEQPAVNKPYWEAEMLRYYASIVATFSPHVLKAIDALKNIDVKMIAPSHGLIWRGRPQAVINKYLRYANYNKDFAEPEVCVVWGSMYGNTEVMLSAVLRGVAAEGVSVKVHRIPNEEASFILADAYRAAGLIIGVPTYEYSMFPPGRYILELFVKKHLWYKKVGFFGSYGWSGGAQKDFDELSKNMYWDVLDPLTFRGYPTPELLEKGEQMGATLARQMKEIAPKQGDEEY